MKSREETNNHHMLEITGQWLHYRVAKCSLRMIFCALHAISFNDTVNTAAVLRYYSICCLTPPCPAPATHDATGARQTLGAHSMKSAFGFRSLELLVRHIYVRCVSCCCWEVALNCSSVMFKL